MRREEGRGSCFGLVNGGISSSEFHFCCENRCILVSRESYDPIKIIFFFRSVASELLRVFIISWVEVI
jgi:hypothetical protein